ncbi:single-stranded-DNA-specific exonuclease RecJ [Paenibacillus xylaniclasticus]|uniref:single-stranded-DNA-specific exonuclease RecJ n=1 Tax=Paenibacillus xylaniclasticus TaxID=588083 RepID=UPI000FDCC652|nr:MULTISPECIES: DHH family phosphoesterase [Paenibacillus]GFN32433.1 single-stranded-DNA-specific exonuclease RecJ [Paenibacillus curdlanolyticus]
MKFEWKKKKPKIGYNETFSVIDKLAAINGIEEVFEFMYPSEDSLHNPYLLKNIEEAKNRIIQAIEQKQNISIYADVDTDGVSSTAIIYRYLLNFTDKVSYFHSQRSDGHGIKYGIDNIPEETKLLIIVDSSSNDREECKLITRRGIDIIILDHHTITQKNEYCILVNPQQKDCNYPNKNTSGSLIAYKVCQVLDDYFHENYSDNLVDLAAFGLYSDLMSMLEYENRFLINHFLNNVHNEGLRAILKVIKKENVRLTSTDIGYSITPFINAATRMDKIELPLKLLTTDDPVEALDIAKEMADLNEERKRIQKESVKRLRERVNEDDRCIVVVDGSLGKGFNGLIANDLANIYKRPVVILGETDDEYQGSFRSYGNFDFLSLVSGMRIVTNSGGHACAGGVSIKKDELSRFKEQLNKKLKSVKFETSLLYDLELETSDISEKLIKQVMEFGRVSGEDFEEPRFLIKDLVVIQKNIIGGGNTIKLGCLDESETWFLDESDYEKIKPKLVAMRFKADDEFIQGVEVGQKIDIVGTLNLNEWIRYKPRYEVVKTNQVFIDSYRISNN